MDLTMPLDIQEKIGKKGIIAVLEIERVEDTGPLMEALLAGGISAIELTLRTPAAEEAIAVVAEKFPEMLLGIGTVILPGQAGQVKKLGARFAVSPGTNPAIIREAVACGLPFVPGIATPTDVETVLSLGCKTMKFSPAEALGGISYLKNMSGPYRHLGIKYIPLGGISQNNLSDYASFDQILAVGGSWIAKRDQIAAKEWTEITKRARAAKELWDRVRGG